jgi:transposase
LFLNPWSQIFPHHQRKDRFCHLSGYVYLSVGCIDMRKAINDLSMLVEQAMDLSTFSSNLFVFCNRQRKIL